MKEKTNILLLESVDNNETIIAEPMSGFNGDWIRAMRAKREGNEDKVEEMKNKITITIDD